MIDQVGHNLVFLLGIPHSGVGVLGRLLGSHPAVLCPVAEPAIMLALSSAGKTHPAHPADSQVLGDAFREFSGSDNPVAAAAYARTIYNARLAAAQGKEIFADATPRYHLILPFLDQVFPAAKRIVVFRNPLDIAASYKSASQIDLPALLNSDPGHTACIDFVSGLRRLEQAAGDPGVLSLRYEDLVRDPASVLAKLATSLGISDSWQPELDQLHGRAIDIWKPAFDSASLQVLLDALGAVLIEQLGYSDLLAQLADRGVHPASPEITVEWRRKVDAALALRLAAVEGAATAAGDRLPADSAVRDVRSLRQNEFVTLLAESHGLECKIADLRSANHTLQDETSSLTERMRSLTADLAAAQTSLAERGAAAAESQQRVTELTQTLERATRDAADANALAARDLVAAREAAAARERELAVATAQHERALARAKSDLQSLADALELVRHQATGPTAPAGESDSFETVKRGPFPINPPDLLWPKDAGLQYRPSYSARGTTYLNDEHAAIFAATKNLPGWQDPPDSEKLYEMGYYCGAVILEIGAYGGRTAAVALTGALRAHRDHGAAAPQYYGVDSDPAAIPRTSATLGATNLTDHALVYHGSLAQFHKDLPIVPTMVHLDGEDRYEFCLDRLKLLASFLAPGTPVYVHDYHSQNGVRRAVDEAVETTGAFEAAGLAAGGILLRATPASKGVARGLDSSTFAKVRNALASRYQHLLRQPGETGSTLDVAAETAAARAELRAARRVRHAWPHGAPRGQLFPPTLPNGKPWPRISIVTPSFNQGRYIEETILSVLNQGYPNLEHILIDGASTDDTMQVVNRYRHDLTHVVSEKDTGQSNAINKGMRLATGDILTWLNSDDMLTPGALHAMALAFHTSGADVVSGVCHLHKAGTITHRHLTACATDRPIPLDDLLDLENCWSRGQFWYQPETFFSRSIWERSGAHVDESLFYSMDYELWLRFAEQRAVLKVIGRPIALYRVHEQQKTFEKSDFQPELMKVRETFIQRTGRENAPAGPAPIRSSLRMVFFNDLGAVAGASIAHQRLAAAAALGGNDVVPLAITPHLSSTKRTARELVETVAEHTPDVVVLGNIHSANIDPAFPGLLAQKFPTLHVTHDLWPLTGRCAYNGDCTKYVTGCDHTCPTRHEYPVISADLIRPAWETKYGAYTSENPPAIAAVSAFTEKFARARFDGVPHSPPILGLRYGLDTDIFKPRDRATCREMLGLPQDRFLILFSATHIAEKRKGLEHLLAALDLLQLPDMLGVAIGHFVPGQDKVQSFRSMGYISDPHSLATLYSACDLFVGPSLVETFGQVFIEAAACGTPSVGYPTGGVTESIADGLSGRLAASIDPAALAAAIDELYQNPDLREQMAQWGRLWVENNWSFASAYQRMLAALRGAGIADQLQLAPYIDLRPGASPHPIRYLDLPEGAPPAPAADLNGDGHFGQLQMRVSALEAERDALRKSLNDVTATRLWRTVAKLYPTYVRLTESPKIPAFLRNTIASAGRALSKRN